MTTQGHGDLNRVAVGFVARVTQVPRELGWARLVVGTDVKKTKSVQGEKAQPEIGPGDGMATQYNTPMNMIKTIKKS